MPNDALQWFVEARFGMFIHWGTYAIPARGEWVKENERITDNAYQPYLDTFHPVNYDPRQWAQAAKQAGMRYAVMTAKHHDGFCLFDSQLTDYTAANTPAGRDLIREYVEAFRAEGLKVGFYYSLLDWHHPDYPIAGDRHHPLRNHPEYKDRAGNLPRYVEYLHQQVRELLTNYGPIDIIWFDFSYDTLCGEAWEATKLVQMVRALQPNILLDDRMGGNLRARMPEIYAGDFVSPEQYIPPEGMLNNDGHPLPWEACLTLNDHWGYAAWDRNWKSPKTIIRSLVECVSKGGNMLLNVGPDATGEIPEASLAILHEVGCWMRRNGRSIHGCGQAGLPKPEWGRLTRNADRLYAHIFDRGIGPLNLRGLAGQIRYARLLRDDSEISLTPPAWMRLDEKYPGDAFLMFPAAELPDDCDTVVELILNAPVR